MITDSNHACFAKMATCGFQGSNTRDGVESSYSQIARYLASTRTSFKVAIWKRNQNPIITTYACIKEWRLKKKISGRCALRQWCIPPFDLSLYSYSFLLGRVSLSG